MNMFLNGNKVIREVWNMKDIPKAEGW